MWFNAVAFVATVLVMSIAQDVLQFSFLSGVVLVPRSGLDEFSSEVLL